MTPDTPMDPSAQDAMADDWAQALEEQSQASSAAQEAPAFDAMDDAFAPINKPNSANDINMVLDIPVQLSVELGRTKVPIKYILQLGQGSVVELDALAGEPMDVLVNGYLIAQGEVVVVNDKFGIRLTDIVTPSERLKRLSRG
jgi:flagellar motor switch protein FliN/FliY